MEGNRQRILSRYISARRAMAAAVSIFPPLTESRPSPPIRQKERQKEKRNKRKRETQPKQTVRPPPAPYSFISFEAGPNPSSTSISPTSPPPGGSDISPIRPPEIGAPGLPRPVWARAALSRSASLDRAPAVDHGMILRADGAPGFCRPAVGAEKPDSGFQSYYYYYSRTSI